MDNMNGKTLVITGATKGIGEAIATKFASKGVNIAFTYNSNADIANELAQKWEKEYGIKAKAYPLNILEPDEFKPLFEAIDADFDRVDFFDRYEEIFCLINKVVVINNLEFVWPFQDDGIEILIASKEKSIDEIVESLLLNRLKKL